MKASWKSNGSGGWGVLVEGDAAGGLTGQRVEVRRRDGQVRPVTLGALIESWDSGRKATYHVVRTPRGPEMQPMSERSGKTYTVAVRVTNDAGEWVEWQLPVESIDEKLVREASIDIARHALNGLDVLTNGTRTSSKTEKPKKAAAPARPSRARKPATTRKAA
jgi:hypothetical protein